MWGVTDGRRPGMAAAVLQSVFEDIEAASKAGTLDETDDMHLSRTPMVLDRQGWDDVSSTLKGSLERLLEIQHLRHDLPR